MTPLGPYRTVYSSMWGDEKFRSLSPLAPSGQALWIFLLTAPERTALPGLLPVGSAALAERLEWPRRKFDSAVQELVTKGMLKVDQEAKLFWIPNAVKYNRPQNANVVKGWAKLWLGIPECKLKSEAHRRIRRFLENELPNLVDDFLLACPIAGAGLTARNSKPSRALTTPVSRTENGFGNRFRDGCDKDSPNQEQEHQHTQEQQQKQEQQKQELQQNKMDPDSSESGTPATEVETYRTKKGRTMQGTQLEWFHQFWQTFDFKNGKAEAADAWLDLAVTDVLLQDILHGAKKERAVRKDQEAKGQTPKWPQGWLSGRRWEKWVELQEEKLKSRSLRDSEEIDKSGPPKDEWQTLGEMYGVTWKVGEMHEEFEARVREAQRLATN